jgi:hypothetical protein
MPRSLLALALCLIVALAIVACDGDGSPATSPTPEATATAAAQASVEPGETPGDGNGDGGNGGDGEETPAATVEASPTPLAVQPPEDLDAFLQQYEQDAIRQESCASYDPDAAKVDCEEFGQYSVDPLPQDPKAICHVLLVNEEPIAVTCTSQEPLTVIYYVVEQQQDQS